MGRIRPGGARTMRSLRKGNVVTLYEKKGRRYHPVHDDRALEGLPNGCWFVVVDKGRMSVRRAVDDQGLLAKLAATDRLKETTLPLLREASQIQPGRGDRPLTEKEKRAYKAFEAIAGKQAVCWWHYRSLNDIAERVVSGLLDLVKQEGSHADRVPGS